MKIIYIVFCILFGFFTCFQANGEQKDIISDELKQLAELLKMDTEMIMQENAKLAKNCDKITRCYDNPDRSVVKLVGFPHKDCKNQTSDEHINELINNLNNNHDTKNESEKVVENFYYKVFLKHIPREGNCASKCHENMEKIEKGVISVKIPVKFELKQSYNDKNNTQDFYVKVATDKEMSNLLAQRR